MNGLRGRQLSRHSAAIGTAAWIAWQLWGDPNLVALLLSLSPLVLIPLLLSAVAASEAEAADEAPLLRGLIWAQLPCALVLVLGLRLAPGGLGLALCLPWAAWTLVAAVEGLRRVRGLVRPGASASGGGWAGLGSAELAIAAGLGFPLVGSAWLLADRLGLTPLGFSPLIVLLTAVHFHHAGLTLPIAAGLLGRSEVRGPWRAVALTIVLAVPLVAVGITVSPLLEWIGSWLTAGAAMAVGLGLLVRARDLAILPAMMSAGAGASLLAAMIFAGAYALGEYLGVPWPDIASMIQLHGAVNALGFGLLGAWAWHLSPPRARPSTNANTDPNTDPDTSDA